MNPNYLAIYSNCMNYYPILIRPRVGILGAVDFGRHHGVRHGHISGGSRKGLFSRSFYLVFWGILGPVNFGRHHGVRHGHISGGSRKGLFSTTVG
jgi:hypothetical protein